MSIQSIAKKVRKPEYEILPLFYTRWSPRAMTGEVMTKEELLPLFEAARWAPSSYNNQPWRFIVAVGKEKGQFMNFLGDFNRQWCKNASALVVIVSSNLFDHNKNSSITHSFDTGAAWMSLALEGARRGLVVHGMEGFDYETVKQKLSIPETYTVEMMFAVGKPAKPSLLPEEMAKMEIPNTRKPVKEFVNLEGKFEWK